MLRSILPSVLLRLSRRRRLDQDLQDEIDFHLAMKSQKLGGDPAAARRSFGNETRIREDLREAWSFLFLESLWQDLRHATRSIIRTPGYACIAILSLAIGVGANTAIFTLLHGMFLKSLPVHEPAQLRIVNWTGDKIPARQVSGYNFSDGGVRTSGSFSFDFLKLLSEHTEGAYESAAGFAGLETNIVANGHAQVLNTLAVSEDFFGTLGLRTAGGRPLGSSDNRSGAPDAAVVSWSFAERSFGSAKNVLGKTVAINRTPYTVVGVLPPAFTGLSRSSHIDLYVPISKAETLSPWYSLTKLDSWWVQTIVRVKHGISDSQLRTELDTLLQRETQLASAVLGEQFRAPKSVSRDGSRGLSFLGRQDYRFLMTLFAMVGIVLLIACANVATLMLARGSSRAKELAVRLSIGAGRARIVRRLVSEAFVIALAGALAGLALAHYGTILLASTIAADTNSQIRFSPDTTVLGFTMALMLVTVLLAGLAPALRASSVPPVWSMRQTGSAPATGQRFAYALVGMQAALALMLVAGAGLFGRTLINLSRIPAGFQTENLLLFYVDGPRNGYEGSALFSLYDRIEQKLAAIPGVQAVTVSRNPLLSNSMWSTSVEVPHREKKVQISTQSGGARYLGVMGIRVRMGRDIGSADRETSPKVVVVNRALAAYFTGNPLGQQLRGATVVGIADDAKFESLTAEAPPTAYFPLPQVPDGGAGVHFAVRTAIDSLSLAGAVREAVAEVDPTLPVANLRTQTQQIETTMARERTFAGVSLFFAAVAVLLACIGVYGVLAHSVARRTGEFGIRLALGSTRGGISWLIVRGILPVLALALITAIPLFLSLSKLVEPMLFGIDSRDPLTIAGSAVLVLFCAVMAALIPGLRAAKCDPVVSLRYD